MKIKFIYYRNFSNFPICINTSNGSVMYSLLTCLMLIIISNHTFCQKLSPEVISSAGNISKSSSVSLDWTLGETVVESSKTNDKHYTQGFHQTYLKVTTVLPTNNTRLSSDYNMTVFPNPVEAILEVKISSENLPQDEIGKVDLFLFNLVGQQLLVQKTNEKSGGSTFIDMSTFASGTYFLKAQKENGVLLKSFKITKVR